MPKIGKVERYLHEKIEEDGAILLALIDPDKTPFEKGATIAEAAYEGGADVILVGGSIGAQGIVLDKTTKLIRDRVDVPIILFPGNVGTITPFADAIYFMNLLNSRDVYWTATVLIQGAPVVKKVGIEPIPTTYVVLEPGRAVGWIGNANLVPRDRPDLAAAAALAAEYSGSHLLVMDSGSGAPTPAPPELIRAVRNEISIMFFYGGGCRTPEHVRQTVEAGADGVQIGTAFELSDGFDRIKEQVRRLVAAAKEAGKKRVEAKQHEQKEKRRGILPLVRVPRFWRLRRSKKQE